MAADLNGYGWRGRHMVTDGDDAWNGGCWALVIDGDNGHDWFLNGNVIAPQGHLTIQTKKCNTMFASNRPHYLCLEPATIVA